MQWHFYYDLPGGNEEHQELVIEGINVKSDQDSWFMNKLENNKVSIID